MYITVLEFLYADNYVAHVRCCRFLFSHFKLYDALQFFLSFVLITIYPFGNRQLVLYGKY